jgi:hypothetical protein
MRKRPDWSHPLPQPLSIPGIMDLVTLADVRELLRHLPEEYRARETWRYVTMKLNVAARDAPVIDVVVPLRMVLLMEGITCRSQ